MSDAKPHWLLKSRAYLKATKLVNSMIESPKRLLLLVRQAQGIITKSSSDSKDGKLSSVFDSLSAVLRLLKAYGKGDYRSISLESLALLAGSIIYLVMPVDVLPDFLFSIGFVDDVSLLAWTFRAVAEDLNKFLAWEQEQGKIIDGECVTPNNDSENNK